MVDRSELLNDPETAFRQGFQGGQAKMRTSFPGIVSKVNLAKMTCEVVCAIQAEVEDEFGNTQFVKLPPLPDCPIQFPSAGGFTITFPVAVGDEVLVHISDRCIDAWWQSGGIQPPAEFRMHDLSDGFCVPGIKSQPRVLSNISTTDLQIRNDAGTAHIGMTPAGLIELSSATGIKVNGNLVVSGTIGGGPTGAVINLETHTHSGVTTGGGTSGPPLP